MSKVNKFPTEESTQENENDGHKHIVVVHHESGEGKKDSTEITIEDGSLDDLLIAFANIVASVADRFGDEGKMIMFPVFMAAMGHKVTRADGDEECKDD